MGAAAPAEMTISRRVYRFIVLLLNRHHKVVHNA
jgi:hypothetical protein